MVKECEHELLLINEEYLEAEEIIITLQCSLCNKIFKGLVKEEYGI